MGKKPLAAASGLLWVGLSLTGCYPTAHNTNQDTGWGSKQPGLTSRPATKDLTAGAYNVPPKSSATGQLPGGNNAGTPIGTISDPGYKVPTSGLTPVEQPGGIKTVSTVPGGGLQPVPPPDDPGASGIKQVTAPPPVDRTTTSQYPKIPGKGSVHEVSTGSAGGRADVYEPIPPPPPYNGSGAVPLPPINETEKPSAAPPVAPPPLSPSGTPVEPMPPSKLSELTPPSNPPAMPPSPPAGSSFGASASPISAPTQPPPMPNR